MAPRILARIYPKIPPSGRVGTIFIDGRARRDLGISPSCSAILGGFLRNLPHRVLAITPLIVSRGRSILGRNQLEFL